MKRDLELVAKLLIAIEATPPGEVGLRLPDGYDSNLIQDHLCIMWDAGLIEAIDASSSSGRQLFVQRMTWSGHEFLDSVRKGDFMEQLRSKWKDAPFEVVRELAMAYAKKKLGL
ncbi:MAG TPA: DUF2513 domain-containing protein [Phycisphaerae bacterium]|nr:DUF2513 domain-containing protein [Phycisphaerae bacterium]